MDRGDLANLSAFVTVSGERSFRAAASQLDVTPSALSHSMRQLGVGDDFRLPGNYLEAYGLMPDGVAVPVVRDLAGHVLEPILEAAGGFDKRSAGAVSIELEATPW